MTERNLKLAEPPAPKARARSISSPAGFHIDDVQDDGGSMTVLWRSNDGPNSSMQVG